MKKWLLKSYLNVSLLNNFMKTKFLIAFVLLFKSALCQTTPGKPKITDRHLVVSYYPNGKIREKGYQGYYTDKDISTGMFMGTWNRYDSSGKLIQSVYYHNDIISKAYIQKKKYYPNGKVKSIELFNNYELYESEIDSIGTWKYFDPQGRLVKKIVH